MSKANDLTPDSSLHTDRSQSEINAKQINSFEPRRLESKGVTDLLKVRQEDFLLKAP